MQTEVETVTSYSKKLKVQLSPQDLEPSEQKVTKKIQKNVSIPGFRRGRAPVNIIRQRFGNQIQQELIEEALKVYYTKALEESNINPLGEGKIIDFKFENVKTGMQFTIELEVEPEFEIKKYKGLKVEKDIVEVTNEMIDEALHQLQEQYATVKEAEEAEEGHYLTFTAQELDKGDIPVLGHKYENLQVQIGSGKLDPDIEMQLIGIKKGEKRIVRKQVPPAPDDENKQPLTNSLEIDVIKIEEKEFPELNDEFAKNIEEEDVNNLEELNSRLHESLRSNLENRSEENFNNRLIDELLKENVFDVPPVMLENYLDRIVEDAKKKSDKEEINEEELRKSYRPSAIHYLRWHYLKMKLCEIENITVTENEALNIIDNSNLDEKNKILAKSDKHYLEHLKEDLLERNLLNLLKEHAEIIEVYPTKHM